jgi:hypothetical protein
MIEVQKLLAVQSPAVSLARFETAGWRATAKRSP